jgi:hypothetical protein
MALTETRDDGELIYYTTRPVEATTDVRNKYDSLEFC